VLATVPAIVGWETLNKETPSPESKALLLGRPLINGATALTC
jgi:hypothetical protein